jgi:two-component system, chemotaxis family, CheB/CheR fusion protein
MANRASDPDLEALLLHLKETRGFDFTGYKRATLERRVRRRMQIVNVGTYADYLDYLEVHPEEFAGLFNTILINVTSFFRDAEAWAMLRSEIVPDLLNANSSGPIRVWSAGCATGEEAYGLAVVFAEALGIDEFRDRVKIYATDVDEEALAVARQATVSEQVLSQLPTDVQQRYFEPNGQRRTFRSDLRRSVIFGRNDLLQDAPISRIDLLSCRNTLMYFNADAQGRILERFRFALKDTGILFLGKAEMLLAQRSLFEPVDLKHRFFRKVPANRTGEAQLAMTGGARLFDLGEFDKLREEAFFLAPFAQVTVTADGTVAATNLRADSVFGIGPRAVGRPLAEFEVSYRPIELRRYIDEAVSEGHPVTVPEVSWARGTGGPRWFDVLILPIVVAGRPIGVSITFEDSTRFHKLQEEYEEANRQLEAAYEELQSTNEELETTNEELQSTVEELETTNEELQSTNEELETMNEELQSMNDELQSINEELRDRTTELDNVNRFMDSVLKSLRAAVVVVGKDMEVQAWNRRAEDFWGLRQDEVIHQHFLNLDIGLPVHELAPVIRSVLAGESVQSDGRGVVLSAVNRRGRQVSIRVNYGPLASADGPVGVIMAMDELEDG